MNSPNANVTLPDPLSKEQQVNFNRVLNMIIPASADGGMPAASEYDVWTYIAREAPHALVGIKADFEKLDSASRERNGAAFSELGDVAARRLVEQLREEGTGFFKALARQTVRCYYQQDAVLAGIGMEARPPYPGGYDVVPGDLSLLEPVKARGKIYREV